MQPDRYSPNSDLAADRLTDAFGRTNSPLYRATFLLSRSLTSQLAGTDMSIKFQAISQALEQFGHVFHVESPRIWMCKRVVEATPGEERFWRASDPELPRNLGSDRLWFGWDASAIYDPTNKVQFQGCFCIDGRVIVNGNAALLPFISTRSIELVHRDLKLTANALRKLFRAPRAG